MVDEIWKQIEGWPYEVSNMGNVRRIGSMHILKTELARGYRQVGLWSTGKERKCRIGRAVAIAFLGVPEPNWEVNHKDGNRANDLLENLEWVTPSQNVQHSIRLRNLPRGFVPLSSVHQLTVLDLMTIFTLRESDITPEQLANEYKIKPEEIKQIQSGFWLYSFSTLLDSGKHQMVSGRP